MRYLERSILLKVIDNRWREHLFDMDYLREGIHLRGFAQIDPLVAYKNEGFGMFEELMHSIWEEFSKLIFHVEVEVNQAQAQQAFGANGGNAPAALSYSGGTPDAQPSALQQVAQWQEVQEVPRCVARLEPRLGARVHSRLQRAGLGRVRRHSGPGSRTARVKRAAKGRRGGASVGDPGARGGAADD